MPNQAIIDAFQQGGIGGLALLLILLIFFALIKFRILPPLPEIKGYYILLNFLWASATIVVVAIISPYYFKSKQGDLLVPTLTTINTQNQIPTKNPVELQTPPNISPSTPTNSPFPTSEPSATPNPPAHLQSYSLPGNVDLQMVWIPPGTFLMGSPQSEKDKLLAENDDLRALTQKLIEPETRHKVTLTMGFQIGKFLVTQGQWEAVMGENPSFFSSCGTKCPIEYISWEQCQVFIKKLNSFLSGGGFRLPTEAEWEYACRGGNEDATYGDLNEIAWFKGNSRVAQSNIDDSSNDNSIELLDSTLHSDFSTHPVGQKQPNPFGLYDMIGNVWEYCNDRFGNYPSGPATDPKGPKDGLKRVIRGGSIYEDGVLCRSASRNWANSSDRYKFRGFRLAGTLP